MFVDFFSNCNCRLLQVSIVMNDLAHAGTLDGVCLYLVVNICLLTGIQCVFPPHNSKPSGTTTDAVERRSGRGTESPVYTKYLLC